MKRIQNMSDKEFALRQMKIIYTLDKADGEFNKLSSTQERFISEQHTEGHGLSHCLRWGLLASKELISIYEGMDKCKGG